MENFKPFSFSLVACIDVKNIAITYHSQSHNFSKIPFLFLSLLSRKQSDYS